ncbi:cell wall glucanase [Apodospora peruviana]|uniref:Cell wall glucanase n=1 Tax=Apodospora peruviana TaxID=516989 RepID=A0AAE0IAS1_9PEZI|nr:cell wall glucanase [Apodospora peruviana]
MRSTKSLSAVALALWPLSLAGLGAAQPVQDSRPDWIHRLPMRPANGPETAATAASFTTPHLYSSTIIDNAATSGSQVPRIIVYIDENGKPLGTTTEAVAVTTPSLGLVFAAGPSASPSSIVATELPIASAGHEDGTGKSGTADIGGNGTAVTFTGVTYSPYNSDGTCKTAAQVFADIQQLEGGYSMIRIYGTDCDQIANVMTAADAIGASVFLGIFDIDDLEAQIAALVDAVLNHGGWSLVDTVSVGNELVNNGQATPDQVMDAVTAARAVLRVKGYAGPVVTVDTFIAVQQHPVLCDASDYCAMNVHAFFDPNTSADQAGNFVLRQVANVREVLADRTQRVVVTEAGWPTQGNANDKAVPGKQNQLTATKSIVSEFGGQEGLGNLILFTAFNDPWKKAEPGTFYAEQFWGMHS